MHNDISLLHQYVNEWRLIPGKALPSVLPAALRQNITSGRHDNPEATINTKLRSKREKIPLTLTLSPRKRVGEGKKLNYFFEATWYKGRPLAAPEYFKNLA
jgi:hypothetical protein